MPLVLSSRSIVFFFATYFVQLASNRRHHESRQQPHGPVRFTDIEDLDQGAVPIKLAITPC